MCRKYTYIYVYITRDTINDSLETFPKRKWVKIIFFFKSPKWHRVLGLHIRYIHWVYVCKCVNYISNTTMVATKQFFLFHTFFFSTTLHNPVKIVENKYNLASCTLIMKANFKDFRSDWYASISEMIYDFLVKFNI